MGFWAFGLSDSGRKYLERSSVRTGASLKSKQLCQVVASLNPKPLNPRTLEPSTLKSHEPEQKQIPNPEPRL